MGNLPRGEARDRRLGRDRPPLSSTALLTATVFAMRSWVIAAGSSPSGTKCKIARTITATGRSKSRCSRITGIAGGSRGRCGARGAKPGHSGRYTAHQ